MPPATRLADAVDFIMPEVGQTVYFYDDRDNSLISGIVRTVTEEYALAQCPDGSTRNIRQRFGYPDEVQKAQPDSSKPRFKIGDRVPVGLVGPCIDPSKGLVTACCLRGIPGHWTYEVTWWSEDKQARSAWFEAFEIDGGE